VIRYFTTKRRGVSFKTICIAVLAAAIFGIAQLPAFAYVLQGPHLLLLMTDNFGRAKNLIVHQTLNIFDQTMPGEVEEISETLTYRFSSAFRSDSQSTKMHRIHVDTIDDTITVYDEKVSLNDDNLSDRYKDLLLFRSRVLLQERLVDLGVDLKMTSLGRFEQRPVFILGAQYPDESLPQVWIEKETFRPIRWLIPQTDATGNNSLFEIRYLQWEQHEGMWYPMQIQCFQDQQLTREILVGQMAVNAVDSETIFDIEYLKMRYALEEEPQHEVPASETKDAIQKVIDDFKKRYE
jgi:hypothetical protein